MRPDLEKMHAAINALGVVVQHLSVLGQAERNWLIRKLDDMNHSALAEHAPCPDGVENCPGDCAGAPANYTGVVPNAPGTDAPPGQSPTTLGREQGKP